MAFLGTGLLGTAMIERMLAQGDSVTVWNRTISKAHKLRQAGAIVAETAVDAAMAADRVHLTLSDDAVVDAILAEVVPSLRPGAIVFVSDHQKASQNDHLVDRRGYGSGREYSERNQGLGVRRGARR